MTTRSTTTVTITGAASSDVASFVYDTANNKRSGSISLTHNGVTILFTSVAELNAFVNDVIIPMLNKVHDLPGTVVTPYAPASAGVASPNALVD